MQKIIYCPVCGTNIRFRKFCPGCRYELARDYEMFPTLGSIPGNMTSVPAQRQNWEKQQLRGALNELLQPLRNELREQEESKKRAVEAADLARQEAMLARQEAAQAKKHSAELQQKLLRLEERISSGRTSSTGRTAAGASSTRASSSASQPKNGLINIKNNTCIFGSYPQGADGSVQPILWRVLDVDQANHKALLLSEKILDCRPYYTSYQSMNWDKAGNNRQGLRYWLNHDFFKRAFRTDEEQNVILLANVIADANPFPKHQTNQGTDVLDKIFLLSAKEVIRYFANSRLNIAGTYARAGGFLAAAQGTEYTKSSTKLHQEANGKSRWWLRSVGNFGYSAAFVRHDGDIDLQGISVISDFVGIRPALWVDLRS